MFAVNANDLRAEALRPTFCYGEAIKHQSIGLAINFPRCNEGLENR